MLAVATAATPAAAPASTSALSGARPSDAKPGQQVDYMKLIVAQMRNLNPMDPNSGGDSLPTMMQAESLNQLTQLNGAIKELQVMTQTSYAATLVGRTVTGVDAGAKTVTGVVRSLRMEVGGPMLELDSGKQVRLLDVTKVSTDE